MQAKPWWKRWWVWAIAAFLLIGAIGSATDEEPGKSGSQQTSQRTESESDAAPEATPEPEISVDLAHVARTVRKSRVRVTGSVDPPDAQVDIDGRTASVRSNGSFSKTVPLTIGSNVIDVEAEASGHEDFADSLRVTRKRSAAELHAIRVAREKRRIAREQRRQARLDRLTQNFSGNGSQNVGTVKVEVESLLEWTNSEEPEFRQMLIYDKGFGVSVSSDAAAGKTVVEPGTYRSITVAGGDWTIVIHPR